ncbi:hypothetical protein ASD78_06825 [Lysobacter sp. Root667]|uniref:SDR family oxidoreductase n=1 Tax=Lysobacter sp. Root667 TaxID=1736581 RepID=UPI0006FF6192|nr:SDR family oxidoreductase [Lysobacter sp. Root667]KRA75680.1 hypothetical protein ASD78_06825 [Lysobacter sp. Root667]
MRSGPQRRIRHLLAAAARAGVAHYLALSVVGTPRLQGSAYFRAKQVQERLVAQARVPHTLVRATQFFEFMANIIPPGSGKDLVHLSPARVQPVVADVLADIAIRPPSGGTVEVAGPEPFRLSELVQWVMYSYQDDRPVIADAAARYYGAVLDDAMLTPGDAAVLGDTSFRDWLDGYVSGAIHLPQVHHPHPLAEPAR